VEDLFLLLAFKKSSLLLLFHSRSSFTETSFRSTYT